MLGQRGLRGVSGRRAGGVKAALWAIARWNVVVSWVRVNGGRCSNASGPRDAGAAVDQGRGGIALPGRARRHPGQQHGGQQHLHDRRESAAGAARLPQRGALSRRRGPHLPLPWKPAPRDAARLAGHADAAYAAYAAHDDTRQANEATVHTRACTLARAALGDADFGRLQAEGRLLRNEQIEAIALATTDAA